MKVLGSRALSFGVLVDQSRDSDSWARWPARSSQATATVWGGGSSCPSSFPSPKNLQVHRGPFREDSGHLLRRASSMRNGVSWLLCSLTRGCKPGSEGHWCGSEARRISLETLTKKIMNCRPGWANTPLQLGYNLVPYSWYSKKTSVS